METSFKNTRSSPTSSAKNLKIGLNWRRLKLPPQDIFPSFQSYMEKKEKLQNLNSPTAKPVTTTTFEIEKIKVQELKSFPIDLDLKPEIQNLLNIDLFKSIQATSLRLFNRFNEMLFSKQYLKMVKLLFWTIFLLKFQLEKDAEILVKIRVKLGKVYGKFFASLGNLKEDLSNSGILTAGYICHMMFYNLFPKERPSFDMRFILNCYHIVIHELNGIFVSDFYVQTSIEKLFGNKFFFYEEKNQEKKKTKKPDLQDEPLFKYSNYDLKDITQTPGGISFAKDLSTKLRIPLKRLKTSTLKELSERNVTRSANASPQKGLMRLTELDENLETFRREGFFPKLKLNCHQISPTVSNFLDSSSSSLPFQRKVLINYTNNKPSLIAEGVEYEPKLFDEEVLKKLDKREKAKSKGSVSDYRLKVRPEDYYLNHIPPNLRDKFRNELDLKYVLDNVKVALRGSYTMRDKETTARKPFFQPPGVKNVIEEKEDEESVMKKSQRLVAEERGNASPQTISPFEEKESAKELNGEGDDVGAKETSVDKLSIERGTGVKRGENALFPKVLTRTRSQKSNHMRKASLGGLNEKNSDIAKKEYGQSKDNLDKNERGESRDEIPMPRLKYEQQLNRKLGKGMAHVNLEQAEAVQVSERTQREFVYKDNRGLYMQDHGVLLKGTIDTNINEIVQKLLVKKTVFHKNFGKYAPRNKSTKR